MICKKRFLILTLFIFSSLFALNKEEYKSFKECVNASHKRSYFAPGNFGDINNLIFEGRFSDHFFINFRRDAAWAADVSMNLTMRMVNEKSVPIYTPSYNPALNFYHFSKNNGIFGEDIIYSLGVVHNSNGQNGKYLNEDGSFNYKNGNFSANYITIKSFSLHRDKNKLNVKHVFGSDLRYYFIVDKFIKPDFPSARLDVNIESLITDWNTKFYDIWNISKEERKLNQNIYMLSRIKLNVGLLFGYMRRTKCWEDRIILETTYSFKPFWLDSFSFFAKYYYGKDYYNIHFNEKISQLSVGIMTDNFTFRSDK